MCGCVDISHKSYYHKHECWKFWHPLTGLTHRVSKLDLNLLQDSILNNNEYSRPFYLNSVNSVNRVDALLVAGQAGGRRDVYRHRLNNLLQRIWMQIEIPKAKFQKQIYHWWRISSFQTSILLLLKLSSYLGIEQQDDDQQRSILCF